MEKEKIPRKKKPVIAVIAAAVIGLMGTLSYAFFTAVVDTSNQQEAQLRSGTMALTFADNDNGINEKLMFGDSVTKKFTIANTGTLDTSLSLDWDQLVNTYMNGSLTYKLEYSETEDGEYQPLVEKSNIPVSTEDLTQTLASEISVPAGEKYYYNLVVTLENLPDVDQSDDLDAIFHTKFTVDQPVKYRYYTLTVDPDGGVWNTYTDTQTYHLQNGDTMELPEPTKEGYTFGGWQVTGTSSGVSDGTFTMGMAHTTVKPKWVAESYTLTIDADGGEYTGETSVKIGYEESTTINTPTKEGYTFNGWTISGGKLEGNTFTLTDTKDVTITASWSVNSYSYTIIHRQMNVSGSGYTQVDSESGTMNYGEELSPTPKTYTGFTSPSKDTITIGVDENKNVITYDYERNQYTLTIDADGGTYSGQTSVKMYFEGETSVPDPTKEGYTFAGWDVSAGSLSDTTYTMSDASNATLTAKWEANDYAYIVYHHQMDENGTDYTLVSADTDNGTAKFGSTVTPNTKTYTGFTSPNKTSLTIKVDTNTPPTLNVVNYQYTRNKYTLTIDAAGGTYSGDTSVEMYYGTSTTLSTPSKEGYTFAGWSRTAGTSGTLSDSTFTMETSNATVTAGWTVNAYDYTVNHYQMNLDGSTYTLESTQNLSANYGTTQTPAVKTYTGFTSPSVGSVTIGVDTTKNVVDYYYARNQYTLTVNANGGTTTVSSGLRYYGATVALSASRTGYDLANWSRTAGTAGTVSGNSFIMGASAATVTANWTAKTFTVTFNANGGTTSTASKTVTYASTYEALPEPTYTGYRFTGWYTAQTGGTQITSTTTVSITANQTLWAHWEKAAGTEVTLGTLNVTPKSGTPSFGTAATTDEGVYAMEDDYGTSYYYRGAVTNNYVNFAGFYWRIIRINGDGSIRMIYDGTQAYANGTSNTARSALTSTAWNANYNDAKYVGYMFGGNDGSASTSKAQAQTNTTSSDVKEKLDAWYKTNIEDKGYEQYLADVIFCNDRSTPGSAATGWSSDTGAGYGTQATAYGAYARMLKDTSNPTPTFICPNLSTDGLTVDATSTNKGNGALDQPVGMITADEIIAAGGSWTSSNNKYYLYKGHWYWSLSPRHFNGSSAYVFWVNSGGNLNSYYVNYTGAVAPVINLSAEYAAQLTGSGTTTSPYTLS